MPSKSIAQQHLMQSAEHGASFPMAKKLRKSMSHQQLHDFASGSEEGKSDHVIKGSRPDVVAANTQTLKNKGMNEYEAVKVSLRTAKGGHPHKNLKGFLHPKKGQA